MSRCCGMVGRLSVTFGSFHVFWQLHLTLRSVEDSSWSIQDNSPEGQHAHCPPRPFPPLPLSSFSMMISLVPPSFPPYFTFDSLCVSFPSFCLTPVLNPPPPCLPVFALLLLSLRLPTMTAHHSASSPSLHIGSVLCCLSILQSLFHS